jgi:hypothetical protein
MVPQTVHLKLVTERGYWSVAAQQMQAEVAIWTFWPGLSSFFPSGARTKPLIIPPPPLFPATVGFFGAAADDWSERFSCLPIRVGLIETVGGGREEDEEEDDCEWFEGGGRGGETMGAVVKSKSRGGSTTGGRVGEADWLREEDGSLLELVKGTLKFGSRDLEAVEEDVWGGTEELAASARRFSHGVEMAVVVVVARGLEGRSVEAGGSIDASTGGLERGLERECWARRASQDPPDAEELFLKGGRGGGKGSATVKGRGCSEGVRGGDSTYGSKGSAGGMLLLGPFGKEGRFLFRGGWGGSRGGLLGGEGFGEEEAVVEKLELGFETDLWSCEGLRLGEGSGDSVDLLVGAVGFWKKAGPWRPGFVWAAVLERRFPHDAWEWVVVVDWEFGVGREAGVGGGRIAGRGEVSPGGEAEMSLNEGREE